MQVKYSLAFRKIQKVAKENPSIVAPRKDNANLLRGCEKLSQISAHIASKYYHWNLQMEAFEVLIREDNLKRVLENFSSVIDTNFLAVQELGWNSIQNWLRIQDKL